MAIRTLSRPVAADTTTNDGTPADGRVFRDGFLVNLFNPKVVLFFLAFLPQFVSGSDTARIDMLVLGGVFFAIAITLDIGYALAGDLVRKVLPRSARAQRSQNIAIGAIYLGLGVYAAAA